MWVKLLAKFWWVLPVAIGLLLLLTQSKKVFAKLKLWTGLGDYQTEDNIDNPDYHLKSVTIYNALHGSKLTENEPIVIATINALKDNKQFSKLVYQYAKDYQLDLRNDILKYFRKSQLEQLKFK